MEDVAGNLATIFDVAQLTLLTDVNDPGSANRDAGGLMVPKAYQPA